MAYSHGKNDGQMPIGVITMALVIFYHDPTLWDRLSLLNGDTWWIIVVSALAISTGTVIRMRSLRVNGPVASLLMIIAVPESFGRGQGQEVEARAGVPERLTHGGT